MTADADSKRSPQSSTARASASASDPKAGAGAGALATTSGPAPHARVYASLLPASARSPWKRMHWRLFLWFFGAIVFAAVVSWFTFTITRPIPPDRAHNFSNLVVEQLAQRWDDPRACDAYLASIKPTLGLDLHVSRDPLAMQKLPPPKRSWVPWQPPHGPTTVPIVRNGATVGAMSWETPPSFQTPAWRFFIFPAIYTVIFSIAAWWVARRLARPIEHVAMAAERFGAGDMASRAQLSEERWLASEVAELSTTFDRMADRIAGVVRDQRELLAAISHEIRSPLGRARIALEIARDRSESIDGEPAPPHDPTLLPRTLARIEAELGEVDTILGDLLAAARAGLSDLRTTTVDLAPWLRARIAAERTPPDVELVVEEELSASIDQPLLGRAVHNLLQNARQYGHPEGHALVVLLVGVRSGPDVRARIIVRDRGPGFPADLIDRAFEPFVRGGDQARTPKMLTLSGAKEGNTGNTGLGLALVRRIAEAHGGLAFATNVDGGAEVSIEIPTVART